MQVREMLDWHRLGLGKPVLPVDIHKQYYTNWRKQPHFLDIYLQDNAN